VDNEITRALLLAEHCWFRVDVVPGQPDITAYKRRARLHQARWRQMRQLPVGGQLQRDGSWAPVGSRLDLAHAEATAANFLSSRITAAVHHRVAHPEAHQTLNMERLWSDLLSSMPMCFNLLGELWSDSKRATAAVSGWFPDVPGTVGELRFEWSPGRLDPSYLGNRSAFDAVFLLDLPGGTKGVLGLETKYHEHAQVEARPRPDRLHRYREVTERSGLFEPGWEELIVGTDLQQLWLDHLLALSIAQHPSGDWSWARFVLVHPAGNLSFAAAADRYLRVLSDASTFQVRTLEQLLKDACGLPQSLVASLRERYLW